MTDLILKNGRIIDPVQNMDTQADILIRNGRIVSTGQLPDDLPKDIPTLDVTGKWCVPGLVDMHVHLREPGREDKETIETGCNAAVAGGYTSITAMPNTDPVNDNAAVTRFIKEKALACTAKVYPVAAITKGLEGKLLTDMIELAESGAVAFSDDGRCLQNADLLRKALDYLKINNGLIIEHCEDHDMAQGGVMREGFVCTSLGFTPVPAPAEDLMVARDIRLAEYTGGKIHIAHISTKESVRLIKEAKERNVNVTAEVTPHHLFLNDDVVKSFDTNTKMNPPLGNEEDRAALEDALINGIIDCVATDHAPHTETEKQVEYSFAPNGVIGLETALSLMLTRLVHTKKMSPMQMVQVMSSNPANILGINAGSLKPESPADITVIDPDRFWMVDPQAFHSKSRNTPFGGLSLRGSCVTTIVNGKIVYQLQE